MRPNLSVEKIAGALAVLGTSVMLAACGGEEKPAQSPADAVKATETSAPSNDKKADEMAKPADAQPAEAKPADAPAATAAPAAAPDAKPATATDPKADAAPAKTDAKKPAVAAPAKKGGGNSCGAGTCGGAKK
jgi:hypothetical protein